MTEKKNFNPAQLEHPWTTNSNQIWLASTITLLRNFEKFNFPGKLSTSQQKQLMSLIDKEFLDTKTLSSPRLFDAEDLDPLEKEFLVEHFLSSQSFQMAHSGEGFILDSTGQFLMTLNMHNHIQFRSLECGGELESAWGQLVKVETALGKLFTYAFSPKFGFLTSEPYHAGTGLLVTVFLQPSALIHLNLLEEVLNRLAAEELTVTGLQGDPNEIVGDVLAVRNTYTLGISEEKILSQIRTFTTKLLVEENHARSLLKEKDNPEVKDLVSRAYAVLAHSYQIDAVEALDAISLVKLGANLGWISGTTPEILNHLFFNCRRAHLYYKHEKNINLDELSHVRAEFIHKTLKGATLNI